MSFCNVPDQMNVIGHDTEAIDHCSFIFIKKSKALGDNVLALILLQKRFPLQDSGSEELRIILGIGKHLQKVEKEMKLHNALAPVVGAATHIGPEEHQQRHEILML
jgi:hypothetical protein